MKKTQLILAIVLSLAMILTLSACKTTVAVSAEAKNGSVAGVGSYYAGDSVTLTATPDEGYEFAGWFKGEEKVSDSATYEFVMPAEAVALTAKFEVKPAEKLSVVFYDYAGKVISAQEILPSKAIR